MTDRVSDAWAGTHLAPHTGGPDQPIIWLHGWGQTHQSLTRLAETLGDIGDHQLLDQPGFGDTLQLSVDAGTADYADALEPQLPDEPVVLVGHSFGARVSLRLAHKHPEKVKALILIAGAGLRPKRSIAKRARAVFLKLGSRLAGLSDTVFGTSMKARYASRYGSADYKNAGALRTTFVKTVNEDLSAIAPTIACPVLLITGSEDTETPPYMAETYARLMPNADCHIIKGYGHLDILTRGVYQCEGLIRAFLNPADPQ